MAALASSPSLLPSRPALDPGGRLGTCEATGVHHAAQRGYGDVYEGQYHDGMMHGRGKYTFADGTVDHDGEWAEDDPVDEDGYPINK